MPFIIRRLWSGSNVPYSGPSCGIAGIEPGKIYETAKEAQEDCDKLNYSSKYFEVAEQEPE
jgi:hypothetical protein